MRIVMLMFASVSVLVGCGGGDTGADTAALGSDTGTGGASEGNVTATMRDSTGRELGTLTLTESAQGISITGTLRGLPPGEHGFHLHAVGQCTPAFDAAGDHWNPTNRQHGTQNPQGPHFGDMSNITVGPDSTVAIQATTPGGTLRGANPLLDSDGAAVMVHADPDDYRSDPAGNAGDRIACGVVTAP